jgi:PEP-CTERM motif
LTFNQIATTGRPLGLRVGAILFGAFSAVNMAGAQIVSQSALAGVESYAPFTPAVRIVEGPISAGTISLNGDTEALYAAGAYAFSSVFVEADGPRYGASSFAAGAGGLSRSTVIKEFTFRAQQAGIYSLSSFINGGSLSTSFLAGASGSGWSVFNWNLSIDGQLQQRTAFSVAVGPNSYPYTGPFQSAGNATLSNFVSSASDNRVSASWGDTTISTSLGFLSASQEVKVGFELSTQAFANFTSLSGNLTDCGTRSLPNEQRVNACGFSTVSFGDPSIIDGFSDPDTIANIAYLSPNVFDITAVTPVPEPSEWAMMLAGLAAVGFVARRRGTTSVKPLRDRNS